MVPGLIEAWPEIVADVQVRFASAEFRSGEEHIYKLWELAHDPRHAGVARHAALPLLRAFPVRCRVKQLGALDHLLWAALEHGDRADFGALIRRKLSLKSLNVAQRVHWLAAGAVVAPGEFAGPLEEFVRGGSAGSGTCPGSSVPTTRLRSPSSTWRPRSSSSSSACSVVARVPACGWLADGRSP